MTDTPNPTIPCGADAAAVTQTAASTEAVAQTVTEAAGVAEAADVTEAAAQAVAAPVARAARPDVYPVLDQLAALYPALFGAVFLPLKRGIFQDLLDAHPELFQRDVLKAALSLHTRSTRYLTAVASGQQRHDLLGQAVEVMAPEHVHHALLEVFRRRQGRSREDLRPKLRSRMLQAFVASGLSREAYTELVRSRDDEANTLLDEALAESSERAARGEALLRAFEASGQTVEVFADMYGLEPQAARRTLDQARRLKAAAPAPA